LRTNLSNEREDRKRTGAVGDMRPLSASALMITSAPIGD